ncbi:MAG: DUF2341 domain-containing protein, partial [Verrucomicrobiota bacterium]
MFSQTAMALMPSNFLNRIKISFDNYPRPDVLTNFPALIKFDPSIPGFYDLMASPTGGDLRFTDATGTNEINYEVETWVPGGESLVWVQVPAFSNSNCVFAYWGNPGDTIPPAYTTDGSTWDSSYIAVWHLDNTGAEDSTANNWDGTSNGNTDTPGIANGGQDFQGGQFIHAGPGIDLANKSFTVSAWVRRENAGQDDYILAHGTGAANQGLHFGFRGNNQFTFAFWANDLNSPADTDTTSWHRWTGVYDLGTGNRVLYRDGVQIAADVAATALNSGAGTLFRIGERFGDARHNGEIDEVRVLCETRSSNWVWAAWLNVASNDMFTTLGTVEVQNVDRAIIRTLPATNITSAGADLIGQLVSTGLSETVVCVYWGTNDGGTVSSAWTRVDCLGTNVNPVPSDWSFSATGLSSGVTYYYRYQASNAAGRVWAFTTESFLTPGLPLIDNEPGANPIGDGQATANGRFLTGNLGYVTMYGGLTNGGDNPLGWPISADLGFVASNTYSFTITGLVYGLEYWYHSRATNSFGISWATSPTNFKTARPAGVGLANGVADGITPTSAVLNASFQAPRSVFDVWVFWGPT